MMLRPLRSEIPIFLAALSPKNVALTAEIADGWLPLFVDPEHFDDAFGESLAAAKPGFEIAATVSCFVGDDVEALRDALKPYLALYVGGMGAKGKNFYNALVRRYGWEEAAEEIQELYLAGKQREAIAAVPDELVDAVCLVGPKERIAERLAAWRETPVTTLVLGTPQPEALQALAGARARLPTRGGTARHGSRREREAGDALVSGRGLIPGLARRDARLDRRRRGRSAEGKREGRGNRVIGNRRRTERGGAARQVAWSPPARCRARRCTTELLRP